MQEITLNNELILSFPDSFHVMEEEERGRLRFAAGGPGKCLSDPERHLLASIGWKKVNGLAARLFGEKDIARTMEAQARMAMQGAGYQAGPISDGAIGGRKSAGFGYSYTAEGKGMEAMSTVVKNGKTVYYLHFYARAETMEEGMPVWEQILGSARWV